MHKILTTKNLRTGLWQKRLFVRNLQRKLNDGVAQALIIGPLLTEDGVYAEHHEEQNAHKQRPRQRDREPGHKSSD